MKTIPSRHLCSFCARPRAEVEFMVKSAVGGLPPTLCSICIEQLGDLLAEYRKSPAHAAVYVEAVNRVAATLPISIDGASR